MEMNEGQLTGLQPLALLTKIRQELSDEKYFSDEDLASLMTQTNLVTMTLNVLASQPTPETKFPKLEAGWILTNLAYGNSGHL